jgi:type IV secretory pathway VirB4 component
VEEFEIVNLEDELDRLVEQQRDLTQQEQGRREKKHRIQKEILELRNLIANNPLDGELDKNLKELREKRVKREEAITRHEQTNSEIGTVDTYRYSI